MMNFSPNLALFATLQELNNGIPTGVTKPNIPGDSDYISPVSSIDCERYVELFVTQATGNNTLTYPMTVKSIIGSSLGTANNRDEFISLWNGDGINAVKGQLELIGFETLKFKLVLELGQTCFKITGISI